MKWEYFAAPAFAVALSAGIFSLLPKLRKRSLYFGVTVTPEFRESDEGREIARLYLSMVWGGAALALILSAVAAGQGWPVVAGLSMLLVVAVAFGAWVKAWARTRPHAAQAEPVRSAPLIGEGEEQVPGGWLTALVPYGAVVCAAAYMALHFDELPQRYPVHWGISGQPDRWASKDWTAVLAPALIGAGVLTLVLVNLLLILRAARRGAGGEVRDFGTRHRRMNVNLLATTMWALGAVFTMVVLLPVLQLDGWRMFAFLAGPPLAIVVLALRMFKLSTETTGGSDGTPEQCWKLGSIYYNPADPALMVEKRSGPGFTLNFGHRLSWLIMGGLLLLVLAPLLMLR